MDKMIKTDFYNIGPTPLAILIDVPHAHNDVPTQKGHNKDVEQLFLQFFFCFLGFELRPNLHKLRMANLIRRNVYNEAKNQVENCIWFGITVFQNYTSPWGFILLF